ncbi:MAG: DUF1501 domain-containing protein [Phycisphaeraceae bacterium]
MTTRRDFLKRSSTSAALLSLAPAVPAFLLNTSLHAAEQAKKGENILVVVQLSGGNDGLNTVIPYADDAYHRNRFTLRVGPEQVQKIDDHIGLHPSLSGLADLVEANQLSIVQGVGYPNPDRSHFSSMDIWHTAMREVQSMRRMTGWVGRYLDKYLAREGREVPALHLGQERQPLAVVAEDVRVPSISSGDSFKLNVGNDRLLGQMIESSVKADRAAAKENELLGFLHTSMSSALVSSQRLQDALKNYKTSVQYPSTGLATKMKTIAQLIDGGLTTRIYYVTLDGFDTHATQAPTHAAQLKEYGDAVAAFMKDMVEHSHDQRVLVMTFSEFGRRVKENASRGTDHGTSAPMFLAGAKVKPGLIGKHPSLTDLDSEGDMKHHTDFRQVYAAILDNWLGADSKAVLGEAFKPAAVLKG